MRESTILTVTDERTHADLQAALGVAAPGSDVNRVEPELIRRLPPAAAIFLSDPAAARIVRATGFDGGIIVVGAPSTAEDEDGLRMQGIFFVPRDLAPAKLAEALASALPESGDGTSAAHQALARSRRLLAAGEIAFGLQHAFNNPLTALMAEVQLLQMEAPTDEIRATAGRMLELVRRLTVLSRSLDGVRERRPTG